MPERDTARRVPVCMRTNEPVPYVFLAMPSLVHAWPISAACWSPATPVTRAAPDVKQQSAGRVGGVGHVGASRGELGDEPRVDGAGGRFRGPLDVLQRPRQLGGGEVGVEDEARDVAHPLLVARLAQAPALVRRAP